MLYLFVFTLLDIYKGKLVKAYITVVMKNMNRLQDLGPNKAGY